ncbi:MAG: 4Fe-4S dicluster domain-containing protein [Chloroflexi bacterium]|nr:4Fe-4S dicluster domain-containing protein [Chloroflexota bacterium]
MRYMLFVDRERCSGCRICEIYCSFVKTKTCNPARSRIGVIQWEEEGLSAPVVCHQCEKAPCLLECPVKAISKDQASGLVSIDQNVCIGCRECLTACPFGAISVDPVDNKVFKCDLCGGEPWCARVCPTGAIRFSMADRVAFLRRREAVGNSAGLVKTIPDGTSGGE